MAIPKNSSLGSGLDQINHYPDEPGPKRISKSPESTCYAGRYVYRCIVRCIPSGLVPSTADAITIFCPNLFQSRGAKGRAKLDQHPTGLKQYLRPLFACLTPLALLFHIYEPFGLVRLATDWCYAPQVNGRYAGLPPSSIIHYISSYTVELG